MGEDGQAMQTASIDYAPGAGSLAGVLGSPGFAYRDGHYRVAIRYQAVSQIVNVLGPLTEDERKYVLNVVTSDALPDVDAFNQRASDEMRARVEAAEQAARAAANHTTTSEATTRANG